MQRLHAAAVLAIIAAAPAVPRPAAAQDGYFRRHSRWYAGAGVGAGFFTLTCDSSCPGDRTPSNSVVLHLGFAVRPQLRIEGGVQYQPGTGGDRAHFSNLTAGLAVFPLGNLYLRGGISSQSVGVEDTTGVTEGKGMGFSVGAGYDVFLGTTFALTPYVNYASGTFSSLERSAASNGGATVMTKGKANGANFGIALSWRRRGRNTGP